MISFYYPEALLLVFLPFLVFFLLPPIKSSMFEALKVPFIDDLEKIKNKSNQSAIFNIKEKLKVSLKFLYLFAVWFALVVGVAKPQYLGEPHRLKNQNRDIMLVIDISPSMLEGILVNNTRTDRLTAVKHVVGEFIEKRKNDRIGLILFGTRAYLQAPLTYDKNAIKNILQNTDAGMAGTSTSIGDALGIALKNLKEYQNNSNKVIILLSDGVSNDGYLSMSKAIDLAEKEKIKVYTIGIQGGNTLISSLFGRQNSNIDEKGLTELSKKTNAKYFKATDFSSLEQIYKEIDKLEPQSEVENIVQETANLFYIPLLVALILSSLLVFLLKGDRK